MEPRVIMMKQFALITILTVASLVACSDKPAQPEAGAGSEVQLRVELPAAEAAPIDAKLEFQGTVLDRTVKLAGIWRSFGHGFWSQLHILRAAISPKIGSTPDKNINTVLHCHFI